MPGYYTEDDQRRDETLMEGWWEERVRRYRHADIGPVPEGYMGPEQPFAGTDEELEIIILVHSPPSLCTGGQEPDRSHGRPDPRGGGDA